jgi:hypothetical protein
MLTRRLGEQERLSQKQDTGLPNQFCQKERTNSNVHQSIYSWQAPEEDRIKINIDASFQAKELTSGWSFVVRNHLGEVRRWCW